MCGERVRGVAGGRAAVWAQGKGQGQEDARPGHPDDADATVCARGSCAHRAAVAPDRRLVCARLGAGRGSEAGAEARMLKLGGPLCPGHTRP